MDGQPVDRFDREKQLFGLLLSGQFVMIGVLVALVGSNWYSDYYHRSMRDGLLENYKLSRATSIILEAARFSNSVYSRHPDMATMEELALLSEDDSRSLTAKARLQRWTRDPKLSADERALASQKCARIELYWANKATKRKNPELAQKHLKNALIFIRSMSSREIINSHLRFIEHYVRISAEVAALKGDKQSASQLRETLDNLRNPQLAKAFYEANDLDDFDLDFSAVVQVQSLLPDMKPEYLKDPTQLQKALAETKGSSLPHSAKIGIWLHAIRANNNLVHQEVLNQWIESATKPPVSKDEAYLALRLLAELPSYILPGDGPDLGIRYCERLADAYERGLLDPKFLGYLESITVYRGSLRIAEINDIEQARRFDACLDRMQYIAHKHKLDDTAILLLKSGDLVTEHRFNEAEALMIQLLARKECHTDNNEALLVQNAQRFLAVVKITDKKRAADLGRKILANEKISYPHRMEILWSMNQVYQFGVDKEWDPLAHQFLKEYEQSKVGRECYDEYKMRALVYMRKFKEAGEYFEKCKKFYPEKAAYFRLCFVHFAWIRAVPSYSAEAKALPKGVYPETCFDDALRLAKETQGENSIEYSLALLYMAQYKFLRHDDAEANRLCDEVLRRWNLLNSPAYLAASDLKKELTGQKVLVPDGKIKVCLGAKEQLNCQASVYYVNRHEGGFARMREMMEHVDEIPLPASTK